MACPRQSRTWLRTLVDRTGRSHEELQRKARVPAAPLPFPRHLRNVPEA